MLHTYTQSRFRDDSLSSLSSGKSQHLGSEILVEFSSPAVGEARAERPVSGQHDTSSRVPHSAIHPHCDGTEIAGSDSSLLCQTRPNCPFRAIDDVPKPIPPLPHPRRVRASWLSHWQILHGEKLENNPNLLLPSYRMLRAMGGAASLIAEAEALRLGL